MIVDETELANTLIRTSFEKIFKQLDGVSTLQYDIKMEIQSFRKRNAAGDLMLNKTIDYKHMLQTASKVSRGKTIVPRF